MRLEGVESLQIHTVLTFKLVHSKTLWEHSSMGLYIVSIYKHNPAGGKQADCGEQQIWGAKSYQVEAETSIMNLKMNKYVYVYVCTSMYVTSKI